MLGFDKYKITDLDFFYFNEEYGNKLNYFWDSEKNICPKENFFFVKAFKFNQDKSKYIKTIEYVSVHPTDIFTLYDFYQSGFNLNHDISYILSYKEIDIFKNMYDENKINFINKRLFKRYNVKSFLLFVNEITNEKKFEIIYCSEEKDLENYIQQQKISSFYLKFKESIKEMKNIYKIYNYYILGKIKESEKKEILEFCNMIKQNKVYMEKGIIDLINEKSIEIQDKSIEKNLKLIKKELLIQYINYFNIYKNERNDQYKLCEDGIFFENVINDITLYRHNEKYIEKLLDKSHDIYIKDFQLIKDEFEKLQKELNNY